MDNEIFDKMLEGKLGRRELLKRMSAAGLVMAATPMIPRMARAAAEDEATYFTWGGYDIPEMVQGYVKKYGVTPNFATFGDSEEGLTKMQAGYVVDVGHPCNQAIGRWKASGLFQPIDTTKLANWNNVIGKLQNIQGAKDDGGQWWAPCEWGQTSITYRPDLVELPNGEETWGILWDEKNAGRISVIGSVGDAYWCAAIYAGVAFDDITPENHKKVMALLRKQRPLVRMYTSDNTTLTQALASGEIVAAMTWNEVPPSVKAAGVDVKWAKLKEGALTWVCGAMLHKDAPHPDRALAIIDALESPEVGAYIIENFGYGHCNTKSYGMVTADVLASMGLTSDPDDMLNDGHFQLQQTQEFETMANKEFEEMMAGF